MSGNVNLPLKHVVLSLEQIYHFLICLNLWTESGIKKIRSQGDPCNPSFTLGFCEIIHVVL